MAVVVVSVVESRYDVFLSLLALIVVLKRIYVSMVVDKALIQPLLRIPIWNFWAGDIPLIQSMTKVLTSPSAML
jgi:hypothetical protein